MKKLVLTKETIRDLSKSELEDVGGATVGGPKCCYTTTAPDLCTGWETCGSTEVCLR